MNLRLKKRKYCDEAKKNLLMLKHDRYLARVHTLVSFSAGLIISLISFEIACIIQGLFSINKETLFISFLIFSIIGTVSLSVYVRWKSIRIEAIESLVDICTNNSQEHT